MVSAKIRGPRRDARGRLAPGRPDARSLRPLLGPRRELRRAVQLRPRTRPGDLRRPDRTPPEDTVAYWLPTVSWDGVEVDSNRAVFYYRAGGKDHKKVKPFQAGLKIIADAEKRVTWRCSTAWWWTASTGCRPRSRSPTAARLVLHPHRSRKPPATPKLPVPLSPS